jgi:hypothetical protein
VPHGQGAANGIAVWIAVGKNSHVLWHTNQLAKRGWKFHIDCFLKKQAKVRIQTLQKPGLPQNIFLQTFFYASFEIKSCSTFAAQSVIQAMRATLAQLNRVYNHAFFTQLSSIHSQLALKHGCKSHIHDA